MNILDVNCRDHAVHLDPRTPTLWVLRDTLGITGTKFGGGAALGGVCTVHLNGEAAQLCSSPIFAAEGKRTTTIQANAGASGAAVHAAWIKQHDVAQCGYSQIDQNVAQLRSSRCCPGADSPRRQRSILQWSAVCAAVAPTPVFARQ